MDSTGHSIFISKSALGNVVLSHDGELLRIRGKRLGDVMRKDIELKTLDPEIRCEFKRYHWRLSGSVLLALGGAIAIKLMGPPGHELMMPYIGLWMLLLFGILNAIVWARRFLFVVFFDRSGREAFALVCEPLERERCEDFLAGLIYSIEHPGKILPVEPETEGGFEEMDDPMVRPQTMPQVSVAYDMPADTTVIDSDPSASGCSVHAWFSLFMGICAVLLPASSRVWDALGGMAMLLLLGCSGAALANGAISFIKQEDMRIYAIYGILLALAPPFLYS